MRRALTTFVVAAAFALPAGFAFGQTVRGGDEQPPTDQVVVAPDVPEIVKSPQLWQTCAQLLASGGDNEACAAVLQQFAPQLLPDTAGDEAKSGE